MNIEKLVELLEDCKRLVGYDGVVKVKLKPYKIKAATVNLKRKTIYINPYMLDLGDEVVRYLLVHELLHLKLNTLNHNSEFYKALTAIIPEDAIEGYRRLIIGKLLELNKKVT
jgi:predicted metal-dependent hydrolase